MIEIDTNKRHKIQVNKIGELKGQKQKMPIYKCPCGINILIVPDLQEMTKAIKAHLTEHKKLTGEHLTEETLTQEIIETVCVMQKLTSLFNMNDMGKR